MILDVQRMLTGDMVRLRYVVRYSNCRRVTDEDVAQHSYYTTLYAFLIAQWYTAKHGRDHEPKIDWAGLMGRAVIHDQDEGKSGDFPRPFKYSSPDLKAALDRAAMSAVRTVTSGIFPDWEDRLPWLWEHAKDDSLEGVIVEIADLFSVVSYLWQERQAGNHGIIEHAGSVREYFEGFSGERFDEFRTLLEQARPIVDYLVCPTPKP